MGSWGLGRIGHFEYAKGFAEGSEGGRSAPDLWAGGARGQGLCTDGKARGG